MKVHLVRVTVMALPPQKKPIACKHTQISFFSLLLAYLEKQIYYHRNVVNPTNRVKMLKASSHK